MQLGVIVTLVFIASTAGLLGIFLMISRRSQVRRGQGHREPAQRGHGRRRPGAVAGESSLLRTETSGRFEQGRVAAGVERIVVRALARAVGHRRSSASACLIMLLAARSGRAGSWASIFVAGKMWAAGIGFALGLCIIRRSTSSSKRSARLYKFEEIFPEALDLLSRGIRAGHAFSAGMKMVADELGEPVGPGVPEGVRRAELRPAAEGIAQQPVSARPHPRRAFLLDRRAHSARYRRQPV